MGLGCRWGFGVPCFWLELICVFFGMARQGKAERGMFWCLCCIFGRYVGWLNSFLLGIVSTENGKRMDIGDCIEGRVYGIVWSI